MGNLSKEKYHDYNWLKHINPSKTHINPCVHNNTNKEQENQTLLVTIEVASTPIH